RLVSDWSSDVCSSDLCGFIPFLLLALRRAEGKLSQGNRGDPDIARCVAFEALQHRRGLVADQMDACVGVEQNLHRNTSERFCCSGWSRSAMKSSENWPRL